MVASVVKKHEVNHVIDILNIIKKADIENLVPIAVIAYKIMLTLPVTVASGERSFSKLSLTKNRPRSTMTQRRLNGLTILSSEKEIADTVNFDDTIDEFSSLKARKCNFKM